jgi:hypothetical protein
VGLAAEFNRQSILLMSNTPPPRDRLVVNRALRRRSGFFGINSGLAIMSLSVFVLGIVSTQFLPINMVVPMTVSLLVATIYIFRDGTDMVMSRFRKPRHYTRGGLEYTPVLKYGKTKVKE